MTNGSVNVTGSLQTSSLNLGGTAVTASAADINKLTNLSTLKSELEFVSGVSSSIQNQLDTKITTQAANDAYSVKAGSSSIVQVGALDSGSITSNFGSINVGAETISTTGTISGGSIETSNVVVGSNTIGHKDDTALVTLANGLVNVAGELQVSTLDIGGTNVTSSAEELNILDGVTANKDEINLLDGVTAGTVVVVKY